MEKTTKCAQCGEDNKKIAGRGLCTACYHRDRRRRLGIAREGERQNADFVVRVDFEPMAYLLEKIRKRASVELRDVNRQILWELNKSMGVQA